MPPENPSDLSAEVRSLIDHLADIGVVVDFADHLSDRELYAWLIEQLGAHMAPVGDCSEEDKRIYLIP